MKVSVTTFALLACFGLCSAQNTYYGTLVMQQYAAMRNPATASVLFQIGVEKSDINTIGASYNYIYSLMRNDFGSFSSSTSPATSPPTPTVTGPLISSGARNMNTWLTSFTSAVDSTSNTLNLKINDPVDLFMVALITDVNLDNTDISCWYSNYYTFVTIYNKAYASISSSLYTIKTNLRTTLATIVTNLTSDYYAEKAKLANECGVDVTCAETYVRFCYYQMTFYFNATYLNSLPRMTLA